jgi:glycerol kinase
MKQYVIALDQGTTSSRAIVYDAAGRIISSAQHPTTQHYPHPGWVEQDPAEIIATTFRSLSEAYIKSGASRGEIAAVGITNQRETTVVWDKLTGKPVYNAIVWQCRRTSDLCEALKARKLEPYIRKKTGLLIDAYFSATKIRWILDNVPGTAPAARAGRLLFGTVDSWLIWNLSGGAAHVSDYSNASRTMLFDIDALKWDEALLKELDIPACMMPTPCPSTEVNACVAAGVSGLEELAGGPGGGCIGDQPAALFGQGCFQNGMAKNTYGTGCFMLMNTGADSVRSACGLVTSVGWSLGGKTSYALEGSVFNAGSVMQWLRDELKMIGASSESEALAQSVPDNGGIYLVPAFNGLGAPYWDMYARGTITGLTRGTTRAHIVRAAAESMAYQSADLMLTMEKDAAIKLSELRVDGGACANDFIMQLQADLTDTVINRPANIETTSAGAAYLAGLYAGLWQNTGEIESIRKTQKIFLPAADTASTKQAFSGWHEAVRKTLA